MGIKFKVRPQGLFVVTDAERDRSDRPLDWPEIRPHEVDDAKTFDEDSDAAYIIREWRYSDAHTGHEHSDLLELHCMTIVFRSGWRVRATCAWSAKIAMPSPINRAYSHAEYLIAQRDPRIGPFWDLPKAIIPYEIRLMGYSPKVALRLMKARLARLLADETQTATCAALAAV